MVGLYSDVHKVRWVEQRRSCNSSIDPSNFQSAGRRSGVAARVLATVGTDGHGLYIGQEEKQKLASFYRNRGDP